MSALEELAEALLENRVRIDRPTGKVLITQPRPRAPREDELLQIVRALDPSQKLAVLAAMGFTAHGSNHTSDCPYAIDAGYVCNCVPPPTEWSAPRDVQEFMGDDWASRVERGKKPRPIYEVER